MTPRSTTDYSICTEQYYENLDVLVNGGGVTDRDACEVLIVIDRHACGGITELSSGTSYGGEVARRFWYRIILPFRPKVSDGTQARTSFSSTRPRRFECEMSATGMRYVSYYYTGRSWRTRQSRSVFTCVKRDTKKTITIIVLT